MMLYRPRWIRSPPKNLMSDSQHSVAPGGLACRPVFQLPIPRPLNDLDYPLPRIPKAT